MRKTGSGDGGRARRGGIWRGRAGGGVWEYGRLVLGTVACLDIDDSYQHNSEEDGDQPRLVVSVSGKCEL